MTTIAWPSGIYPRTCQLRLQTYALAAMTPHNGAEQVTDVLADRWVMSVTLPPRGGHARGAQVEAFIAALRGMVNTVNLYHFARPQPLGTLASATCGATSAGVQAVTLSGTGTLKAGDLIGISGQLLQVAADVSISGSASVSLVNRVRAAISGGTSVTLTRPTAAFRLMSAGAGVTFVPGASEPVTLDFAEVVPVA